MHPSLINPEDTICLRKGCGGKCRIEKMYAVEQVDYNIFPIVFIIPVSLLNYVFSVQRLRPSTKEDYKPALLTAPYQTNSEPIVSAQSSYSTFYLLFALFIPI